MKLPGLLLIAGTGRNSGKTMLACRIIEYFSPIIPINALKISDHIHRMESGETVMAHHNGVYIAEENDSGTGKDSSRMLAAGAVRSFFIMAAGDQLLNAFQQIIDLTGQAAFFVCESAGLRKWIEPGLFLFVTPVGQTRGKSYSGELRDFEYIQVPFNGVGFDFNINRITIQDNGWKMKSENDIL